MVAALLGAVLVPLVIGTGLVVADRTSRPVGQRTAAAIALAAAALTAACVGVTIVDEPEINRPWVSLLDLRFHLAVDGISAPLLVLAAGVGLLAVLHGIGCPPAATDSPAGERYGTFLGCLLLVTGSAIAAFLARDAILFFLAFELVLIPMWLLIKGFGDLDTRAAAADRFAFFAILGSALMLVGILAMTAAVGSGDLDTLATRGAAELSTSQQTVIAALLLVGLGIKVPVFPLHSWLPSAHTAAPTAGSMLLAAVLLKVGTYGIIRLVVGPLTDGLGRLAPTLATAAVIGILWASLVCLVETSLKRLIAWSSVAHMGFVVLALSTGTEAGVQAALYGNLAHGAVSALLFVVVGALRERWGDDDLSHARAAVRTTSPRLGLALVVAMTGSLALPGLATFWGELLAIFAAWTPAADRPTGLFQVLAVLAAIGGVLAAAYVLRVLRIASAGRVGRSANGGSIETAVASEGLDTVSPSGSPYSTSGEGKGDIHGPEWVVAGVLILAVVALGLLPSVILPVTEADVIQLLGVVR